MYFFSCSNIFLYNQLRIIVISTQQHHNHRHNHQHRWRAKVASKGRQVLPGIRRCMEMENVFCTNGKLWKWNVY